MEAKDIKRVVVLGAGVMGNGITQVAAQAGYEVTMTDISDELAQRGLANIDRNLQRSVDRERITAEEKQAILGRIKTAAKMEAAAESDLVIEVIPENLQLKQQTFKQLDEICRPEVIIASNTSAIPIIEMAKVTKRLDKVVGLHFYNPPPVMRLIELVRTVATSDETVATAKKFGESLGKTVVVCADSPGFIANRALLPYFVEAIQMLEAGVASAEDIDNACMLGYNLPMGPLAVCDLVGLDQFYLILSSLYDSFKDTKYAPPPLLKQMVAAGRLGRKTGRGFHDYTKKR